jgi:hypothetical protein
VAKVGTSKAGGTISQQAAVHPWLAADAHGNKQTRVDVVCRPIIPDFRKCIVLLEGSYSLPAFPSDRLSL